MLLVAAVAALSSSLMHCRDALHCICLVLPGLALPCPGLPPLPAPALRLVSQQL